MNVVLLVYGGVQGVSAADQCGNISYDQQFSETQGAHIQVLQPRTLWYYRVIGCVKHLIFDVTTAALPPATGFC